MFKPTEEKSNKTNAIITQAFNKRLGNDHDYTLVYAYYMKSGLFSKKMFSYVVGFSVKEQEIVVIPLDGDGNPSDPITMKKSDIVSAKYGLQGDITIKNNITQKPIRIFVPPYTPTSLESMYVLPIVQEDAEHQFRTFIKGAF